jgi:hypothetical protein
MHVGDCPSFAFKDAAFTMVDGGLTATLPSYAAGDVLVLGYRHTTGTLTGWDLGFLSSSGANQFETAMRIADGSEGSSVSLPSGSGYPAVIASWTPTSAVTQTSPSGSPPFGNQDGFFGSQTSSVAGGDTPGTFPVFAYSQLVGAPDLGEVDSFSIAFVLTAGSFPSYNWNHETERARFLDGGSGWAALVADGQHDTTTTSASPSTAPSITWGVSTSSIYHGAIQFLCGYPQPGGGVSDCEITSYGDLINDDFADALSLSVFPDSSFLFSGGFAGSHSPIDGETTVGATKESGEPDHNGNTGGHSIWFSYVPLDSGVLYLEVDGNGTDSIGKKMLLAVYTGASVGALTEITYDVTAPDPEGGFGTTNACGEITPFTYLEATVTSGTTYYIAVDVADGDTVKAILLQGNLE